MRSVDEETGRTQALSPIEMMVMAEIILVELMVVIAIVAVVIAILT